MLKTPEKMPSSGEPLLGIFSDDVGNLFAYSPYRSICVVKRGRLPRSTQILYDVVSLLRVIPSIWANLEPYSNHVNRRKTRTSAPNRLPSVVGAELIFR